ncbi:MAG TPA: acetate--CoA ligase family protein [Candidatus Limnocylindria bacterium]|nr:acetate--CoA ligase family protein [Candidatus Limnocylindria bacterium]
MSGTADPAGAADAAGASRVTARTIDIRPLFSPRSVAVVGASPRSNTARILRDNIARVGGDTRCYFVNPKYAEVEGAPCYPDITALPEVPDIAVVAINPLRVAGVVREATAAGVPAVMIPGGGVIEGGETAARMQAEVAAIALESGIALLGPNCMGVIDLHAPSATYIDDLPEMRRGGTVAIAQSGSVTNAFVNAGTRIGWSRIVSCGSEAVLDVCDYMAASLDDPTTDSVVLFMEGFKRPERFLALADRALAMDVPVLAVKVGRSAQAQAAAVSHSGSLAGDARATEAAMRAAGVVLCDDLDELLEAAALVSRSRRLGRRVGQGRTAVVTVSTGEGSLIADVAPRIGLSLPPIPAGARAQIRAAMPTLTHVENPIDPWGAGDAAPTYRATFEALADSGAYDVLALVHDFPFGSPRSEAALAVELGAELIAATADRPGVLPAFVSLTSGDVTPEVSEQLDQAGGVPILRGALAGLGAISRLAWWERRLAARARGGPARATWPALAADVPAYGFDRPPSGADRRSAGRPPARVIPERESLEMLRAAGLPIVESIAVEGRSVAAMLPEATAAAERTGWPVAVKLDAPGLSHKTEVGGVELGVAGPKQLGPALRRILAAGRDHDPDGVLIQPMARKGVELIVGGRRDPQYGALVLVGLGGIHAELLDDVALRLVPLRPDDALEMLSELNGARVLEGARGGRPVNRQAIAQLLVALGDAMTRNPSWLDVDLNPVIVGHTDAIAVDALIVADPVDPAWDFEDPGGTDA